MIVTVTLNPALDVYLQTDFVEYDAVLRSVAEQRCAGGKGLNVSRMLRTMNVATRAVVFSGRETGEEVVRLARGEKIDVVPINVPNSTRINVHVKESTGRHIKINQSGAAPDAQALVSLGDELEKIGTEMRGLVLSGTLPPGVRPEFYGHLIEFANGITVPSFLDTSGESLTKSVQARPTVLKINRHELAELMDKQIEDNNAVLLAAQHLNAFGVPMVCVTNSDEGALLVTSEGAWKCSPSRQSTVRAVGAGDSFLAGLASAYIDGESPEEVLKQATACGTAWAISSGNANKGLVDEVKKELKCSRLE